VPGVPVELILTPERRGPLRVLTLEHVRAFGVDAFITTRAGGVSEAPFDSLNLGARVGDRARHVATNRARVAEAARVAPERLVTLSQVHGASVLDVSEPVDGEGDGLVTSSRDLAIAILVADCLPVLFVDASTRRAAVVHAGWRGLHAGVLAAGLSHFADARNVHVVIGPGVSPHVYQVGPDVAAHFGDVPGALSPDAGDRSRLNLRAIALAQLAHAGVADEHVSYTRDVTDGGAIFFSDRASRPTGRFGLVARVLA
jgi:polyphenol oxidase